MRTDEAVRGETSPQLIAGRYEVDKQLGRGGMAVVYQVRDVTTQRVIALKRLVDQSAADGQVARLFEREFHTLSQLVHPRIIEVYDYQTDDSGPFYTMELLSGGDLRQRSPISWPEACRLLCDVCSALALLHSRRFVHRDLTPLNIRCTPDGRAKLFDFGSMAQFGRSKHVVGTPPFVAPEALHGQLIDGQTDLFALGATAYYALTGRHAYAARGLADLPDLWLSPPGPPSRYAAEIPPALDELVMELLQLAPADRPPSASEVMERLSAIGGFEIQEALLVSQAYLSTPTLVGREEQLDLLGRLLQRTSEGRGTSVLVSGAEGTGRSRLLDACALEAKLFGALVLQADVQDGTGQRWSVATALLVQLIEQVPELAAAVLRDRLQTLAQIMPELRERFAELLPDPSATLPHAPAQASRGELQTALQETMQALAKQRLLVLVVDDVDRIDEPSAALLALLANQAREHRMLVIVTAGSAGSEALPRALQLLTSISDSVRVRNLDAAQTEQLVISLFGEVHHVHWLAARIHGVSRGNPGLIMQIAHNLVGKGMCRYAAGTWTLPGRLDADELVEALRETFDRDLAGPALDLARLLALCAERVTLTACLRLGSHGDAKQLQADVLALAVAGVVSMDDDQVGISRASWERQLLRDLPDAEKRALHLRVAAFLAERPDQHFRVVQHLLAGGERADAFDRLVALQHRNRARHVDDPALVFDYIQSLPKRWPETFHALIDAGRALGRSRHDRLILQMGLLGYSTVTARTERALMLEVTAQLRHDAGLDLWEELAPQVPEAELLQRALTAAQQRFDATPLHDRGLPLLEAITTLAQMILYAIGMAARTLDRELLLALPSLAPLVVLSPALAVVQQNRQALVDLLAGRSDHARRGYLALLERLQQPDGAGLKGAHLTHMRLAALWAVGTIEANAGRPRACERADALVSEPLFAVSGLRLRAIYALFKGDRGAAEAHRTQTELLQIQNSPPQLLEGTQALQWTMGYAAIGDLLRVKQCLNDVEIMARAHAGWRPVVHYGRGAYQALRGDHVQALSEFDQAQAMLVPGTHLIWIWCAAGSLWALANQERFAEALERGRALLDALEALEMQPGAYALLVPLALIESSLGQSQTALDHVQTAIELLRFDQGSGVQLGAAYEVRAKIALHLQDAAAFATYADACETEYRAGGHGALLARHAKLIRAGRKAGLIALEPTPDMEDQRLTAADDARSTVSTVLSTAQGPEQRAERALVLLGRFSRCDAGYLYINQRHGPALVAQLGAAQPLLDMDGFAGKFLREAVQKEVVTETEATTVQEPKLLWTAAEGSRFAPMLLSHEGKHGESITGVAVMWVQAGAPFRVPKRLLQALSRALYEAGDAVTQHDDEP